MATVTTRENLVNSNGQNVYDSPSFTPVAGELLVIVARITGSLLPAAAGTASASANGITFARAANGLDQADAGVMYLFVANQLVPASPVAMTVSIDVTGDTGTGVGIRVYGIGDMSRTGLDAIRNNSGAENTGQVSTFGDIAANTPSDSFPAATLTGNPILAMLCNNQNPAGVSPPTNFTEDLDSGHAGPTSGYEFCTRSSGHVSATVTWGSLSAGNWAVLIVELDASASEVSVTADAATLILAGVDGSAAGSGTASKTADPAALALFGVDASTAGSGAATRVADAAVLTLAGGDATADSPLLIAADPATLLLTGADPQVSGTGTALAVADNGILTLAGVTPPVAGSGPSPILADPATLLLAGGDAVPLIDIVIVADPAVLALSGRDATPAGSGAAAAIGDVAVLMLVGGNATADSAVTIVADAATLTLLGGSPTLTATGAAAVLADTALLTLTGATPSLAGSGAAAMATDPAVLELVGADPAVAGVGNVLLPGDVAILLLVGAEAGAIGREPEPHPIRAAVVARMGTGSARAGRTTGTARAHTTGIARYA